MATPTPPEPSLEPSLMEALKTTQALSVDNLSETQLIQALLFYYQRYRGVKAFMLDHYQDEIAFKGFSRFLVQTSPDTWGEEEADPIETLKQWILKTLKEMNSPNITLVISCPAQELYRFSSVVEQAEPPLAHIDFAPLHDFEEIMADARLKYDMIKIEKEVLALANRASSE